MLSWSLTLTSDVLSLSPPLCLTNGPCALLLSVFHLPCLFNPLHLPHPPSSPPPNIPHRITAKVLPKRRHAVESGGLARAAIARSLAVWFSLLSTRVYTRMPTLYGTEQSSYTLQVVLQPCYHHPREWEDEKESVLQSEFLLSAPDFHAHIFHVYAKLLRALYKISSFSSLIPTLVHALMTLKAKGCFFRHNSTPAVSVTM